MCIVGSGPCGQEANQEFFECRTPGGVPCTRQAADSAEPLRPQQFKLYQRVQVHSLDNRLGLNGALGLVTGWRSNQITVRFVHPHGEKVMSPANLRVADENAPATSLAAPTTCTAARQPEYFDLTMGDTETAEAASCPDGDNVDFRQSADDNLVAGKDEFDTDFFRELAALREKRPASVVGLGPADGTPPHGFVPGLGVAEGVACDDAKAAGVASAHPYSIATSDRSASPLGASAAGCDQTVVAVAYDGVEAAEHRAGKELGYLRVEKGEVVQLLVVESAKGHAANRFTSYVYVRRLREAEEGWLPCDVLANSP